MKASTYSINPTTPLAVCWAVMLIAFALSSPICSSTARADTKVCVAPFSVDSPCSAVCLPPDAATQGLLCLDVELPKLRLLLDRNLELYDLKLGIKDRINEVQANFIKVQDRMLDEALALAGPTSTWKSPLLWAAVGFVVGAAVTIAVTYAVNDR